MDRQDWLLLLLAFKSGQGSPKLDPVRIQKGMFLMAEEGGLPADEKYTFEPLHYGPYSRQVRRDVDKLVGSGLVEQIQVPGYTWSEYRPTPQGLDRARAALGDAPTAQVHRLFEIKSRITGVSFAELLRAVYKKYPKYAEKSVFIG